MAARGLSHSILSDSPRAKVEKERFMKPRSLTLRSHKKKPTLSSQPAMEPIQEALKDHIEETEQNPINQEEAAAEEDDDDQDTATQPAQQPPPQQTTTITSNQPTRFRFTPGPNTTSYAAIAAMEARNLHLNMTISSPSATGGPSTRKSTSQIPSHAPGVRNLVTTGTAAQARSSVQFAAAADSTLQPTAAPGSRPDSTPLLRAPTAEDLTMLDGRDALQDFRALPIPREQIAIATCSHVEQTSLQPTTPHLKLTVPPKPSKHAMPDLSSPPRPFPELKLQSPPRHPPKSQRSPTHTLSTPSPLRFTSPSIPSTSSPQT
ncbi:AP2-associated protein kinase 1-like [Palaemon carinicauda]|uniref:AP2-associated protein kinase 1-like n=1 Tax=Palaemon carinicauda TaxID=392227 RepID=UPI0035B6758F